MDEHGVKQDKGRLPTRKWIATQVTATAAFATAWVTAAEWNSTLSIAMIGLISQAVISYLVPNADTPGGVPTGAAVSPAAGPALAGADRSAAATMTGTGSGA